MFKFLEDLPDLLHVCHTELFHCSSYSVTCNIMKLIKSDGCITNQKIFCYYILSLLIL